LLAERRGLQAVEGVILGDEIGLLRVLIRRFAEQIQDSPERSPQRIGTALGCGQRGYAAIGESAAHQLQAGWIAKQHPYHAA